MKIKFASLSGAFTRFKTLLKLELLRHPKMSMYHDYPEYLEVTSGTSSDKQFWVRFNAPPNMTGEMRNMLNPRFLKAELSEYLRSKGFDLVGEGSIDSGGPEGVLVRYVLHRSRTEEKPQ